jgi:hypothetical protein
MTNDEVERAIEFIVKQQAQVGADMQQLAESQGRTERQLGTVVDLLSQLTKTQLQVAEAQVRSEARIAELAQGQKRTDEALAETNDRLNSLIVVVERYFSNGGRN